MIRRPPRSTPLSLHDALPIFSTNALELGVDVGFLDAVVCCGYPGSVASIWQQWGRAGRGNDPALAVYIAGRDALDRKSTRLNSSHANISYAVFCLKKKT